MNIKELQPIYAVIDTLNNIRFTSSDKKQCILFKQSFPYYKIIRLEDSWATPQGRAV